LLRCGSELGGEQSGHIILSKISKVGDGMMTALFLLEGLQNRGERLSEAYTGVITFPQILVNVPVKSKRPFNEVPEIAATAADVEHKLGSEGRMLLRYSGTENLARVMIEGKNKVEIDALANSLADVIRKELG